MKVNETHLEMRIQRLNEQMQLHGENHKDYNQWITSRDYYVRKLAYMDEHDLQTVEI
jgi:hypothetical protein